MPIAQRSVDPSLIFQSRSITPHHVPIQNLSSTSLIALTSIIRQLSAISQYADEMFGDIFNEASKYVYRSSRLESRVQNLAHLVEQKRSDQIAEIPEMPTPAYEKPEQHILNVYIPRALKERYHLADCPPPLHLFAHLRIDGKDGPSMYTDPTLFFRAWLYNMNKEANNLRNPNKKRSRRSRNSIRANQVLYMGPTSASPPPMYGNKLSLPPNPLYENRDHIAPTEPGLEDNIYEMLPENIDEFENQDRQFSHDINIKLPGHEFNKIERVSSESPIGHDSSILNKTFNQGDSFNESSTRQEFLASPPADSARNTSHNQSWREVPGKAGDPLSSPYQMNLSTLDQQPIPLSPNNGSFCLDDLPPPPDDMLLPVDEDDLYDVLPVRNSPMKNELARYSPIRNEPIRHSPIRNEPIRHSPIRNEPLRHSPIRNEPLRHSPIRNEPLRHSPIRSESLRHSPIRNEPGSITNVDSGHVPPPVTATQLSRINSEAQPQNDLMAAIRAGINLRPAKRVQEEKKTVPSANTTPLLSNDVASILQRRKYLIGDMCDDSNSSEEESDNVWSDEEDDSWN